MDVGDSAAMREGHGDVGQRDVLGEFGNDQDIKGTKRKKGGLKASAKFFDGGANGFVTVGRIVEKPFTGIGGVADLMAIVGHALPLSGGGLRPGQSAPGGEGSQERKKVEAHVWREFVRGNGSKVGHKVKRFRKSKAACVFHLT